MSSEKKLCRLASAATFHVVVKPFHLLDSYLAIAIIAILPKATILLGIPHVYQPIFKVFLDNDFGIERNVYYVRERLAN